jgi:hypothetical protein
MIIDQEWIPLKDASRLTGKSMQAIRVMIRRGKGIQAKKVIENKRELWLIHRDTVRELSLAAGDQPDDQITSSDHNDQRSSPDHIIMISTITELYERQRKELMQERDQALQGLMMYRYKFEEIEHKMRLLPAPVEMVTKELEDKAAALAQAEKILEEAKEAQQRYIEAMGKLKEKLQEEERVKEAYRIQWEMAQAELKKSWWQKLFGRKK